MIDRVEAASYPTLMAEAREMARTGTGTPTVAHIQAQDSMIRTLVTVVDELQVALLRTVSSTRSVS